MSKWSRMHRKEQFFNSLGLSVEFKKQACKTFVFYLTAVNERFKKMDPQVSGNFRPPLKNWINFDTTIKRLARVI